MQVAGNRPEAGQPGADEGQGQTRGERALRLFGWIAVGLAGAAALLAAAAFISATQQPDPLGGGIVASIGYILLGWAGGLGALAIFLFGLAVRQRRRRLAGTDA